MRPVRAAARPGVALLLVLALGWSRPGGASPLEKRSWTRATTQGFVVTGDGGARDTRRTAEQFARIQRVFQRVFPNLAPGKGVRVPVLCVRGARGMRRFGAERGSNPSGAVRSGWLRRDILIRSDLVGGQSLPTIYHEYVHLVLRRRAPSIPLWLNEGLAEVWSDLDVSNPEKIRLGRPSKEHLETLRSRNFVPLGDLLSADHLSELYRKPALKELFYAQSWALTHYLMVGDERRHAAALGRYVALVGSGMGPVEAAKRQFGDFEALEHRLLKYVRGLTMPYLILTVPAIGEEEIVVRRLSEAESLATLAEFLAFSGERETARELFDKALALEPNLGAAHQGLALEEMYDGSYERAAAGFSRALEADPELWVSHFGRAISLGRGERAGDSGRAIEKHLERAVQIHPSSAPALCRLGAFLADSPDRQQVGLSMVRRAIAVEPDVFAYRMAEVSLIGKIESEEASSLALERLLARARTSESARLNNDLCWHGALAGFADRVLPACDLASSLEPESGKVRDSRGLARALAGDRQGAIEDFRFVVQAGEDRPEEFLRERAEWLRELEAGGEPFDPEAREALRRQYPPWDC